ncbi:TetR/AcrR family transcriptional regulator [Actinoplanes sp. CA-015351]|uniref:TetR/AcrR family transcriptional regulator n=1 Tax=Actinoplanes sp. CA-015351 TaxID=3239897 RepID=UPI003D96A444
MTNLPARNSRRSDALSRRRIVEATVELLDTAGEDGLTVRALTAHLSTGRGAIYHHVANKEELLAAAVDDVVGRVTAGTGDDQGPEQAIRALALGIFNAIDAHPWVGTQLSHAPLQPAVFRIWKSLGVQLQRLGVPGPARADAGSALVNYVLGAAAQHAAGARQVTSDTDRKAYLQSLAAQWAHDDPDPLVRETAAELHEHDDREQFLAGLNIFLTGVTALHLRAGNLSPDIPPSTASDIPVVAPDAGDAR